MTYRTPATKRILVVDDDPAQARLIAHWLSAEGVLVLTCGSAEEALATLKRTREWDLLITDFHLPGGNGLQLASYCKHFVPDLDVLMITASQEQRTALNAVNLGIGGFILKPLRQGELLARTRRLLQVRETKRRAAHSVLAIGAHPDDVEIAVGGTLARHVAAGDDVTILVLSSGSSGGVSESRRNEARMAADELGARLVFGGLRDTQITAEAPTISAIQQVITATQATHVYVHSPHDTHQDHRGAYQATMVAARSVPNVYRYQSPSTTFDFRPQRFVEVGDFMAIKHALIDMHRSQAKRAYLQRAVIAATATYWGRFAGFKPVEPLEVERESASITSTKRPTPMMPPGIPSSWQVRPRAGNTLVL